MRPIKPFILILVLLAGALLLLSGCQSDKASIPAITIKAGDHFFEAPAQIEAGLVSLKMDNTGQEAHHMQLVRLNDGVTVEQFQTTLQQDPNAVMAMVSFPGGVGVIEPGQQGQVVLDLAQGEYYLLCFIPSPDGIPHMAKGMIQPLTVVARDGGDKADAPKSAATVMMSDFHFEMPAQLKTGAQTWKIVNAGPQPHEIALIRLAEGKTMEDVMAFMQAPTGTPPFAYMGGMQAMGTDQTAWVKLNLTRGEYVALCFIPDPATGKTHLELGMIHAFTVQ